MSAPMKPILTDGERQRYAKILHRWAEEANERWLVSVWEDESPLETVIERYEEARD